MVDARPSSAGGPPDDGGGSKRKVSRSRVFIALVSFAVGAAVTAVAFVIFATGSPARSNTDAAPPAPAAPAQPAHASPTSSAVLHEGVVNLNKGNAIDLDSTAPDWGETSSASSQDDLELALGGTVDYPPTGAPIHFVEVSPPAAYMTCLNARGYADFQVPGDT